MCLLLEVVGMDEIVYVGQGNGIEWAEMMDREKYWVHMIRVGLYLMKLILLPFLLSLCTLG